MVIAWPRTTSDTEQIGVPRQPELARRRHVTNQRGRGDDRRAREVAFAANAHPVLPVAIERGDRALPSPERIRTLTETGAAPRLPDLAPDRTKHGRDRLATEARFSPFDLTPDATGPREDDELRRSVVDALLARRAYHQRRREQVVVAAVGARPDHGLVERQAFARDLLRRKRVAWTERLRNHRPHQGELHRLVDCICRVDAWLKSGIRRIGNALRAIPRIGDVIRGEDAI